ncbi:hypothetical protein L195_g019665, partial [Trifolium pratense]
RPQLDQAATLFFSPSPSNKIHTQYSSLK